MLRNKYGELYSLNAIKRMLKEKGYVVSDYKIRDAIKKQGGEIRPPSFIGIGYKGIEGRFAKIK